MKKITIRSSQSIICPVSNKTQLLEACKGCDAFKGFHTVLAKDGKIPNAVKCEVDEY